MISGARAHVAVALLGASAAVLVAAGGRSLAPFCGNQWDARAALSGCAFLGLAAGLAIASMARPRGGRWLAGVSLAAGGIWLAPWPWLRQPLLRLLEPAGLPGATILATAVLALVPSLAMGIAAGRIAAGHAEASHDPVSCSLRLAATALAAAWLAASLVPIVLVPHLGSGRSLLLAGCLQLAAATLVWARAGSRSQAAVRGGLFLAVCGGATGALLHAPVVRAAPEFGVHRVVEDGQVDLRVLERDEIRYLFVDGTIVTVADPVSGSSLERGPAALCITDQLFEEPGRALVLGMRGGALAMQLARRGWAVTVVEPEPRVSEIVWQDFGLGRVEVVVAPCPPRAFLRRTSAQFDVTVLDLSGSGALPPALLSREFFALLKQRLAPGSGVFALAVEAQGWEDALVRSLAATLRLRFAHVVALPTAEPPDQLGCVVLLGADRSLELPDEALPNVGAALGEAYRHWVLMQQNHAWFNRYEPAAGGAWILTDDRTPLERWAARLDRAARRDVHAAFGPHARVW